MTAGVAAQVYGRQRNRPGSFWWVSSRDEDGIGRTWTDPQPHQKTKEPLLT
jgi:hypothetical protein